METQDLGIDGLDDIEQIGKGGSSRVFKAKQVELDRVVALKVLKAGDDPNVIRRFDRERKAMGRLSHNEGIVPVYSSGLTTHGEPYLIMAYYERGSLQDRLNRGPVPWDEAVGYVRAAAMTIGAAHQAGVVHLDLKPANILLSSEDSPRIADFGIAKLSNEANLATTTTAAFTPTFTSPEILLGDAATPASDVYGLAATLWSLIAGRPPFRAAAGEDNTLMAVVGRVVHQPVGDLRHLAPDSLCTVIETAMAKDPAQRYPTADALAEALAGVSSEARVGVIPGFGLQDRTMSLAEAPATPGGIRFEEAVHPPFVPAEPSDPPTDRPPVIPFALAGIGGVAVLIVGFLLAGSVLGSNEDDTTGTTQVGSPEILITASTSTPPRSDDSRADVSDRDGDEDEDESSTTTTGRTTLRTTAVSTTNTTAPSSTTTSPTSSTSVASTTTSTRPTTTSQATSTTVVSTTTTTVTTTTSTTTTTAAAPLDPPPSVTASYAKGEVVVSWAAPADDAEVTGYTIRRDGAEVGTTGRARTTFVDDAPIPGATHVYQVRADGDPAPSVYVSAPGVDIPSSP